MKLYKMSDVAPERGGCTKNECFRKADRPAFDLLAQAQQCYDNMAEFREQRERSKRYTYGDQWSDLVEIDGVTMTEEAYIRSQGRVPLKNNLIRRLVRNVLGVYRSQSKEPVCTARDRDEQQVGETMTIALQYNMQKNSMAELLARSMEEFLISGMVVHRKYFGWKGQDYDCWTDVVQPNNFFIDTHMRDYRGWDTALVGEIQDITFEELSNRFATTPQAYRQLSDIYRLATDRALVLDTAEQFGMKRPDYFGQSLLCSNADSGLCRVIEIWRKETRIQYRCHDYQEGDYYVIDAKDKTELVDKVNALRLAEGLGQGMTPEEIPLIEARWQVADVWRYYFLSPMGDVLAEGDTPYAHGEHPYVFKAYPFIDGEIHSFVSDVIDQQRYTNRLVSLYDWIMSASAKGVLTVPVECIPDGVSPEDFAQTWTRFDGILLYKAKELPNGAMPQQIAVNSTNIGIQDLLSMQLKFFEDISGVNGALQGKPGYSSMSGTLYQQQTQNATMSLLDMLEAFSDFTKTGAMKDVKNIQQCYDQPRMIAIVGSHATAVEYNPQNISNVEFDLAINEAQSTPAYRALGNEFLMALWQQQAIDVEQLLENGDFPFADKLLQSIKVKREQMQQAQMQMQQAQQQAQLPESSQEQPQIQQ